MKWIWLIFFVIFLGLALFHCFQTKILVPHHQNKGQVAKISGISTGHKEFVDDFNLFVDELNASNKKMNILAAVGYFAAALTALVSFFSVI